MQNNSCIISSVGEKTTLDIFLQKTDQILL